MFKFVSSVLLLVAAASAHANPAEIYGKWQGTQTDNGYVFNIVFDFQPTVLEVTNTCSYQGQSAVAKASAPEQVTDSQVIIKSAAQNSASAGNLTCNVDIQPYTFNYLVNGNKLTLTLGGQSLDFVRVP